MYDFLDKLCNIWSESTTRVRGSQSVSKSAVTSDVPCDFRSKNKENWKPSAIARETDSDWYEVILPISYKGTVKKGMYIELIDQSSESKGEYVIDTVDILDTPGLTNPVECILLRVSNR